MFIKPFSVVCSPGVYYSYGTSGIPNISKSWTTHTHTLIHASTINGMLRLKGKRNDGYKLESHYVHKIFKRHSSQSRTAFGVTLQSACPVPHWKANCVLACFTLETIFGFDFFLLTLHMCTYCSNPALCGKYQLVTACSEITCSLPLTAIYWYVFSFVTVTVWKWRKNSTAQSLLLSQETKNSFAKDSKTNVQWGTKLHCCPYNIFEAPLLFSRN